MRNGCPECQKLPDGVLCDSCELGYWEWEYERAKKAYLQKLQQIKEKKENANHTNTNS